MRKQWNEQEIEFLKNNYSEMTNKEIAEKLGRTKTSIDIKANKLGLKSSIYTCNLDYFKEIDSEEKAYWLGFIYADGWVEYKEGSTHTLGIELSIVDIEHLRKFNKSIEGNYKITTRIMHLEETDKDYEMCCIRVCKKTFVDHLIDKGVIPNKSFDITMPNIPENLFSHFIRGFFDGGGCLAHGTTKYKNKTQDVIKADFTCGSIEFINSLRSILFDNGINSHVVSERNHYRLRIGGLKNTHEFLEYIYKDATIYLDRKYEKRKFYYEKYNLKERIASLYRNI